MKSMRPALLALSALSLAGASSGYAADQIIPAGSLIQCMIQEPKLSSKTTNIGDPVLCRVTHVEMYGRSALPYGTVLVGRFDDYKDPGHLVGKGWMELKFERMVIQPDTVISLDAKVVSVPGYNVDREGRVLGKGHPVRDIVEWSIPILWPIDLLNLPRRGPRPTLKGETRLTLKVMDDLGVPMPERQQAVAPAVAAPPALLQRAPVAYAEPEPAPAPIIRAYLQPPVTYVPAQPPAYASTYGAPAYGPAITGPYGPPPAGTPVVVMREGVPYRTVMR